MTSAGNRTRVARMVAQWFTYYATAALQNDTKVNPLFRNVVKLLNTL